MNALGALDGLGTILATLGGIEIAHQKRSQERVTRTHGVLHICHWLGMLPIVTLAVIGNAALSASRCGHKTWAQALHPGKALANLVLARGVCRAKERKVNVGSNLLVVLVGRIIREVKRNGNTRCLQLRQLALGKAIVTRMNHIKLFHIRQIKTIEHIARITTDATIVRPQKYTITINHSNARRTVLADELLAFG